MNYITGKSNTFSSWHREDKSTHITLISSKENSPKKCLILEDEGSAAVILLDSISYLITALQEELEEITSKVTEHKTRYVCNGNLAIRYENRGEPYCGGLLLSLITDSNKEEEYPQSDVSVFLDSDEVSRLINALYCTIV